MDGLGQKPMLYAVDVTPLAEDALYAAAYAAATPERRAKADRLRLPEDRRLCLGAELLLRFCLRAAGTELPPQLVYGSCGKPYLPESGVYFSLSHSGKWAVCAAADFELGCDVEKIRPLELKLARRFHPAEYADILAQPTEAERLELFFRTWTLKESFMKAIGLGMHLPLDAFRIVRGEAIAVEQSADERSFTFRELDGLPGFSCAVCGTEDCRDTVLRTVCVRELLALAARNTEA